MGRSLDHGNFNLGSIPGIATNTAATAGCIGEVITSGSVTTGSLVTATITNITSITLTPGDWDISAYVLLVTAGGTTVTDWTATISATTASSTPIAGTLSLHERVASTADHGFFVTFPPAQILISANTTYFLTCVWSGTGTAPTATGILAGRRIR